MNFVCSSEVTESLEVSVFTWNDLVLFAKSCKECTPKHFFQVFGKPKTSTGRPFCPNQLIWTVAPLQGWLSPQREVSLFVTIWCRLQKVLKSGSRFFYSFYVYLATLLSESTPMNCASSSTLTNSQETSAFICNT